MGMLQAIPAHLYSKYDMKHCSTNSKHQHIGAKWSVLWPSK